MELKCSYLILSPLNHLSKAKHNDAPNIHTASGKRIFFILYTNVIAPQQNIKMQMNLEASSHAQCLSRVFFAALQNILTFVKPSDVRAFSRPIYSYILTNQLTNEMCVVFIILLDKRAFLYVCHTCFVSFTIIATTHCLSFVPKHNQTNVYRTHTHKRYVLLCFVYIKYKPTVGVKGLRRRAFIL